MRIRQQEQLYSMKTLKEYVPRLRPPRRLHGEAEPVGAPADAPRDHHDDQGASYRLDFPVNLAELLPALTEEGQRAKGRLDDLLKMQKRLEQLEPARDREPDKRWQAHYDLMLGQIVAYQIKAYEYRACLKELFEKKPKPSKTPTEKLHVWWGLGHSNQAEGRQGRDEQEIRRGQRALPEGLRAAPEHPLGRPREVGAGARLQRRLGRAPARPEPRRRRPREVRAEVLRRRKKRFIRG